MHGINRLQKKLGSERTSKAKRPKMRPKQRVAHHTRHDSGSGDSDDSGGVAVAAAKNSSFPLQMPMGKMPSRQHLWEGGGLG